MQLMTSTLPAPAEPRPALTERQAQVVGMLVTGASIKQIARRLEISPRTVKKHLTSARLSLGAETRDHLVALAVARGMVTP